jgi:heptaprenyl diphosphate synthase
MAKNNIMKSVDTRRIAVNAVFIAMALIMFLVEAQFPPIAVAPGAKMGLSNIFSVVAMVILGPVDAVIIVVVRCLLAVMFGTPASALLYSLTGGVISLLVMYALYRFVFPRVTVIAISVAGAVVHNITQVVVLCLQTWTWEMVSYLPWLSVAGVLAGLVVGFTSFFIVKYLPIQVYYKPKKTGGAPELKEENKHDEN